MIGLDTAKSVFQVHGLNETGKVGIRRKLRRSELIPFFEKQEACTVVMEACGAAHHWARVLSSLGHEVKLIAPEGILAFHSARSLLVKQQTMLANAMRGLATEFGLVVAKGIHKLDALEAQVQAEASMPATAKQAFAELHGHSQATATRIAGLEAQIVAHARQDATARRLATIPGIGPITASLITATVGDAIGSFKSARHFAAWLGLVPRQHSTGGKTRLGRVTKAGNSEIRRLLVLGATSMVHRAAQWNSAAGAWLRGVLERRPVRLATVALANKMARIAWAVMTRGETYQAKGRVQAVAAAEA
jgi:error-prone DNA polymerase